MQQTAIGWTDFSANPLKYRDAAGATKWACAKVSPGCTHCYSEALALRWNRGTDYNTGEVAKLTPFLDEKELRAILTSKAISGKRVFVGDMTDLFGHWVDDALLDELFVTFAMRSDVTFQVLTKRADVMRDYLNFAHERVRALWPDAGVPWPLPNVWIGTSVENQTWAEERIPFLLDLPASVRFISAEPLLAPIDLSSPLLASISTIDRLSWVIVGGESGPRFRACEANDITRIADQCQRANVPVFVKQDAHRLPGQQGRIPDQFWLKQFPRQAAE